MNQLSVKSIQASNPGLEFRKEAIETIGKIVRARKFCITENKGVEISEKLIDPIRKHYYRWRYEWTIGGIARFILMHQDTIRILSTGNKKQANHLTQLFIKAKKYEHIRQRV